MVQKGVLHEGWMNGWMNLDSWLDVFLEMNGYLLGLGPKKGKNVNLPNFISQEMPMTKEEFGNCKNYFKDQDSIVNG